MMRAFSRSLAVGALGITTILTATACAAPAAPVDRTIVIAVDAVNTALFDPAQGMGTLEDHTNAALFESLVSYAPDGSVIPGLATGYVLSDDKKSVEVTLRDDVDFADGTHMDAAGVEKYFDNLLQSDQYGFKGTVDTIGPEFTATGEYTLEVTLENPAFHPDYMIYDALRLLFLTAVLSPAAVDDPELAATEPLGSGPYVIEDSEPGVEVTLVRNPDYWNPDAYPFDTIVLKVIADPVAKLNALKSGQVDATSLTIDNVAEAESDGFTVSTGSALYYTLMVRDPAASPLEPLRDVRVRQAMMLAFDRASIAETLDRGYGRASSQAFIPGQAEYIEGGDERFGYDVEAARDLMAEAGYSDGFDLVIPTQAADASVEPIVQQSLGDIGIRVTFAQQADGLAWFKASLGGEYPVILFLQHNINSFRLLDEEFAGIGRFFEENAELLALVETIRFGDAQESADASQELGEMILDEAWYIPFSRPSQFWASDEKVTVAMNDAVLPFLRDFQLPE